MRLALTDRFVSTCKAGGAPQVDLFDERTPGLALRVAAGGRKTWTFLFTAPQDRRRARLTLGTYPATSLAAARTKALEARGMVEAGQDPRVAFGAQVAGAMTVTALIESWLARHVRPHLRSADRVESRMRQNVLPAIGDVTLAGLHRRDVNRVLDAIVDRGTPVAAARVLADFRSALRWAVARGDLDHDPTAGMSAPVGPRHRDRVLSDAEVCHVWDALPRALSKTCRRIVKLCLITGQRIGEVAGMRRAELDLAAREWKLPGARTKNAHAHVVPLSALALGVIEEALADAGKSPFVFPAGEGSLPPTRVARDIRERAQLGLEHWTAHDLRRTAITGMARLGVAPIVLGHVANHRTTTKAGVTLGIYSHHDYAAEKRQALDAWADRLIEIVGERGLAR